MGTRTFSTRHAIVLFVSHILGCAGVSVTTVPAEVAIELGDSPARRPVDGHVVASEMAEVCRSLQYVPPSDATLEQRVWCGVEQQPPPVDDAMRARSRAIAEARCDEERRLHGQSVRCASLQTVWYWDDRCRAMANGTPLTVGASPMDEDICESRRRRMTEERQHDYERMKKWGDCLKLKHDPLLKRPVSFWGWCEQEAALRIESERYWMKVRALPSEGVD